MHLEHLVEQFGYLAVFLGTVLEGESVLFIAAHFAQRGFLELPYVIAIGAVGAYIGHVIAFWLGRHHALRLLEKLPRFRTHLASAKRFMDTYGVWGIFFSQYIYGIRLASAVAIGLSNLRWPRFLLLQAISCAVWATSVGIAGHFFSEAITTLAKRVFGQQQHLTLLVLGIILLLAFIVGAVHYVREGRREKAGRG